MFQLGLTAAAGHDIATLDRRLNLPEAAIAAFDEMAHRARAWLGQPVSMQLSHHGLIIMSESRAKIQA